MGADISTDKHTTKLQEWLEVASKLDAIELFNENDLKKTCMSANTNTIHNNQRYQQQHGQVQLSTRSMQNQLSSLRSQSCSSECVQNHVGLWRVVVAQQSANKAFNLQPESAHTKASINNKAISKTPQNTTAINTIPILIQSKTFSSSLSSSSSKFMQSDDYQRSNHDQPNLSTADDNRNSSNQSHPYNNDSNKQQQNAVAAYQTRDDDLFESWQCYILYAVKKSQLSCNNGQDRVPNKENKQGKNDKEYYTTKEFSSVNHGHDQTDQNINNYASNYQENQNNPEHQKVNIQDRNASHTFNDIFMETLKNTSNITSEVLSHVLNKLSSNMLPQSLNTPIKSQKIVDDDYTMSNRDENSSQCQYQYCVYALMGKNSIPNVRLACTSYALRFADQVLNTTKKMNLISSGSVIRNKKLQKGSKLQISWPVGASKINGSNSGKKSQTNNLEGQNSKAVWSSLAPSQFYERCQKVDVFNFLDLGISQRDKKRRNGWLSLLKRSKTTNIDSSCLVPSYLLKNDCTSRNGKQKSYFSLKLKGNDAKYGKNNSAKAGSRKRKAMFPVFTLNNEEDQEQQQVQKVQSKQYVNPNKRNKSNDHHATLHASLPQHQSQYQPQKHHESLKLPLNKILPVSTPALVPAPASAPAAKKAMIEKMNLKLDFSKSLKPPSIGVRIPDNSNSAVQNSRESESSFDDSRRNSASNNDNSRQQHGSNGLIGMGLTNRSQEQRGKRQQCNLACSQVIEGLYVSGQKVAKDIEILKQHKIQAIVNCAGDYCENWHEGVNILDMNTAGINSTAGSASSSSHITYLTFFLKDSQTENIECLFYRVIDFIQQCQKEHKNVLIHCIQGISRSVTLIIAYIMFKYGYDYKKAEAFVKQKRSIACPNNGFMVELIQFHKRLYDQQYMSLISPRVFLVSSHSKDTPGILTARMLKQELSVTQGKGSGLGSKKYLWLDSRAVYVVHASQMSYIWVGSKCEDQRLEKYFAFAQEFIKKLQKYQRAPKKIKIISQGNIDMDFLALWGLSEPPQLYENPDYDRLFPEVSAKASNPGIQRQYYEQAEDEVGDDDDDDDFDDDNNQDQYDNSNNDDQQNQREYFSCHGEFQQQQKEEAERPQNQQQLQQSQQFSNDREGDGDNEAHNHDRNTYHHDNGRRQHIQQHQDRQQRQNKPKPKSNSTAISNHLKLSNTTPKQSLKLYIYPDYKQALGVFSEEDLYYTPNDGEGSSGNNQSGYDLSQYASCNDKIKGQNKSGNLKDNCNSNSNGKNICILILKQQKQSVTTSKTAKTTNIKAFLWRNDLNLNSSAYCQQKQKQQQKQQQKGSTNNNENNFIDEEQANPHQNGSESDPSSTPSATSSPEDYCSNSQQEEKEEQFLRNVIQTHYADVSQDSIQVFQERASDESDQFKKLIAMG